MSSPSPGAPLLALVLVAAACSEAPDPDSAAAEGAATDAAARPNVLLVVLDDVGTDGIQSYGDSPHAPPTPNIDRIAAEGALFRLAWAHPICTPTRASLLTGQQPRTSGLGNLPSVTGGIPFGARTIASELRSAGYRTFFVGKWHVAAPGPLQGHPASLGFDSFSGTRGNIAAMKRTDYFDWKKWVGDERHDHWRRYATTDAVDDTLEQVQGSQPWFGILSFHAAHYPLHHPPRHLHSRTLPEDVGEDPPAFFQAMIEAVDTEFGRVLNALPEDTLIFVMGDNGSPRDVSLPPFDSERAKGTPYRPGIRVPLLVSGPGVVHGEVEGPVHLVDLFATLLDWLALPASPPADSVSFAAALRGGPAARDSMISEQFGKPGFEARAALRGCLKLVEYPLDTLQLFDICSDPFERDDLLTPESAPPAELANDFEALLHLLRETGA